MLHNSCNEVQMSRRRKKQFVRGFDVGCQGHFASTNTFWLATTMSTTTTIMTSTRVSTRTMASTVPTMIMTAVALAVTPKTAGDGKKPSQLIWFLPNVVAPSESDSNLTRAKNFCSPRFDCFPLQVLSE